MIKSVSNASDSNENSLEKCQERAIIIIVVASVMIIHFLTLISSLLVFS